MRSKDVEALRVEASNCRAWQERLAVESALQINIDGAPYTITMRTPGDDELLARGLLFTEGIVSNPEAPLKFETFGNPDKEEDRHINVLLGDALLDRDIAEGARSIPSSSSCGMCGKRNLDDAMKQTGPSRVDPSGLLDMSLLPTMAERMRAKQRLFGATGGTHAAAAFTIAGELLAVFEDVGRHNAADKTIGALLHDDLIEQAECLFVSGRISYEIVVKARAASIPFLIAVSAPTSLAVEIADECGMTLIGFCRGDKATVYINAGNVSVGRGNAHV